MGCVLVPPEPVGSVVGNLGGMSSHSMRYRLPHAIGVRRSAANGFAPPGQRTPDYGSSSPEDGSTPLPFVLTFLAGGIACGVVRTALVFWLQVHVRLAHHGLERGHQLGQRGRGRVGLGNGDDVNPGRQPRLRQAKGLSQQTLPTIALDGVAHVPRNGKSQPRIVALVRCYQDVEKRASRVCMILVHAVEFAFFSQT